jgi:hypothetical protein
VAAALAVLLVAAAAGPSAQAQNTRRPRRETTATRKARIAKIVQQTYGHPWEAAGGGGYMRYRSGQYQQQDNQVSFWATTRYTLNSINPKLGILGTVQGSYGYAKLTNPHPYSIPNPQISEYAFMAGPSWRFVGKEKFAVSGFAQAGIDLGKFAGGSKGFSAADIGVWQGDFAPAFSAGVSLDYNVDPSIALRISPGYLGTTFGSTIQNSKVLNVGIVYRFGKQR